MIALITILISAIIILNFYLLHKYRIKLKLESERKQELIKKKKDEFRILIKEIINANNLIKEYSDFNNGYWNKYKTVSWVDKTKNLAERVDSLNIKDLDIPINWQIEINTFKNNYLKIDNTSYEYNDSFIKNETIKYSEFFKNIEGKALDNQQIESIIINEDRNLVIAGAGSGKTTTIVGKTKYLLDKYDLKPSDILLISFTKKSVESLESRLQDPNLGTMTFNKLGKSIIEAVEKKPQLVYDSTKFSNFIENQLNILSKENKYVSSLINHFINLDKDPRSAFDFKTPGEYYQFLKEYDCKTYKYVEKTYKDRKTLAREQVRSVEECKIANFLYLNGIEYKYEEPYENNEINGESFTYRPDFTIYHNGKKFYLEHFGISKDGEVPAWFNGKNGKSATQIYKEGIDWKRNIHSHFKTDLIETYSYEMWDKTLLPGLELKLKKIGIEFKKKSPQEVWELINKSDPIGLKLFISLISTFIIQMKSNEKKINEIERLNNRTYNIFLRERTENLLRIIKPILIAYNDILTQNKEIDFTDMIIKSTNYIRDKKYTNPYKYIIIDEFQDLSKDRYNLISELLKSNPECKLFCVGDDWQSIYRFAGSDVSLFKKFDAYFGHTNYSKIETTYRFGHKMIEASSKFILKNPIQTPKQLKCPEDKETNFQINYNKSKDDDGDVNALIQILKELISKGHDLSKLDILLLGRYNFDISRICTDSKIFNYIKGPNDEVYAQLNTPIIVDGKTYNNIKIPFLSIHKAKGLEADIIIVVNCNNGTYGFPSGVSDDHLLSFLLTEADKFEYGEERRLFYVAMTRAKKQLYLIADELYKSKFILELEEQNNLESYCQNCKTNTLIYRGIFKNKSDKEFKFWSCSNYTFGCDYVRRVYLE